MFKRNFENIYAIKQGITVTIFYDFIYVKCSGEANL